MYFALNFNYFKNTKPWVEIPNLLISAVAARGGIFNPFRSGEADPMLFFLIALFCYSAWDIGYYSKLKLKISMKS